MLLISNVTNSVQTIFLNVIMFLTFEGISLSSMIWIM